MRKSLLTLFLVAAVIVANASKSGDLFRIDEQKLAVEMADLSAIEDLVNTENLTLSQLFADNNELAVSALMPSYGAADMLEDGPPLGIPSFVWGLCLGLIGVLVVYIVTESRSESMKAVWGCVAAVIISVILQLAVFSTSAI
jgi:hypothetical protein